MSAHSPSDTRNAHQNARPRTVADAGFAPDMTAALTIIRHVFQSFALPESHGWVRAFELAYRAFPERASAEIGVAALAIVRSLSMTRQNGFGFCNPDCRSCSRLLSPDEFQLMSLLNALRTGEGSAIQAHAMLLCEGGAARDVIDAMQTLCNLMDVAAHPAVTPENALAQG